MNKKLTKTAILLAFYFFLLGGCQDALKPLNDLSDTMTGKVQMEQKKYADRTLATIKCQELCQTKLATNGVLAEDSPCLSNEIIPDWACDIAHLPRQEIDKDPANQCSAFREGKVHHFVEVDGNCNTIKVY